MLITEFTKRKLITTSTVPEIKNRQTQYLNEELKLKHFTYTYF